MLEAGIPMLSSIPRFFSGNFLPDQRFHLIDQFRRLFDTGPAARPHVQTELACIYRRKKSCPSCGTRNSVPRQNARNSSAKGPR